MTVLIYVGTSKQVGDPDHIKIFASTDAAETWFEENDSEGVASSMWFWNRRPRPTAKPGPTRRLRAWRDRAAGSHI